MALPLGAVLLTGLVIAAVAGFDPRKKGDKKKATNGALPPAQSIMKCAHLVGITPEGQSTIDGTVQAETPMLENLYAQTGRVPVFLVFCKTFPAMTDVLDQVCNDTPEAEFFAQYLDMLPPQHRQEAASRCAQREDPSRGPLAFTTILYNPNAPTIEDPALDFHENDNPGDYIAALLSYIYA